MYTVFACTLLVSVLSFGQIELPAKIEIRSVKVEAMGKEGQGLETMLNGKPKSVAKEFSKYMKDSYQIRFKDKGKKGLAELAINTFGLTTPSLLSYEVQEFEGAAKLSVLPMDFTGEEFKNANSLEYFSILEKAVKDFTKEFYSNALKDELTDARKEASKGNKELSKVVREKEKAENEIVKSEKRINGTESDILKYQQKIKELENQIQSAKASIEDSKQNIVENKLQTIELTKEIRDKTKMVETLKEKERKITEKLEFIMGL